MTQDLKSESGNLKTDASDGGLARQSIARVAYLRTAEAAEYVGLSPRTLEKHRCYGTGPVYRKLGGRVVYGIDQLEEWVELGTRNSTSDPGRGVVHPARRIR